MKAAELREVLEELRLGTGEPLLPDERAVELATRLVSAGPKACNVSASETHEISRYVLDAYHPDSTVVVLAHHADALVGLLREAEQLPPELEAMSPGIARLMRAVRRIHAIGGSIVRESDDG